MDLRFAAFVLIARDAALRTLLVHHADRVERGGAAQGVCSLALSWADADRPGAAAGAQLLTARVHVPRDAARDHACLDTVPARLRATLTGDTARGVLRARCLDGAPRVVEDAADTVFTTSRFEIAPPQNTVLDLPPWSAGADAGATSEVAADLAPSRN